MFVPFRYFFFAPKSAEFLAKFMKMTQSIKEYGSFSKGLKEGKWTEFYENDLVERGFYKNGFKEGPWETFYDDEYQWTHREKGGGEYLNGKRNGRWLFWDSDGEILEDGNYQEGKREGFWKLYNILDRKLFYYGEYKNDIKEGEWIEYYEKGKYINGKREGEWIYLSREKVIWWRGNYINNKKNGVWKYYDHLGIFKKEIIYKDDYEVQNFPEENGGEIIGDDLFGYLFSGRYRICSCEKKKHYFTEEGFKRNKDNLCPIDFHPVLNVIFISDPVLGTKEIEYSEIKE